MRQTGCGGRACAGGDGADRAPSQMGVTNGEAPGAAGRPGHRSRRAKALAERTGASEVPRGPGWCGEGACPRGPRGGGRVRVPCAPTPPSNVFALSGPSDPRRPRSITGQKPIRKTLRPNQVPAETVPAPAFRRKHPSALPSNRRTGSLRRRAEQNTSARPREPPSVSAEKTPALPGEAKTTPLAAERKALAATG